MEDHDIVELFFLRNEDALRQVETKYGVLCHRLSLQICNDAQDAEECVNDAYLALWNSIPPQKPNSLRAYLLRIVRNLSITRYHFNSARKRDGYCVALEELEKYIPILSDADSDQDLAKALNAFLKTLSPSDRKIFVRRYWYADPVCEIANKLGCGSHAISVRLFRIRKKLKRFLQERGWNYETE